jgi:uncharacterized protein
VNFEEPWTETRLGFDTRDLFLDIWVDPDRSWRLLDEDELDAARSEGLISDREVECVRREAAVAIRRIEGWESPFGDGWEHWRPDPAWRTPELPRSWDVV